MTEQLFILYCSIDSEKEALLDSILICQLSYRLYLKTKRNHHLLIGNGFLFDITVEGLLHCHTLRQIPRLINIIPTRQGRIVGKQLQRNNRQCRRKNIQRFRNHKRAVY